MTMQETERAILYDLEKLEDEIDQYSFLIMCAAECTPFDENYRTDDHLVRECQVNTWVYTYIKDGILYFLTDSEALIIKGAMALLQEIYNNRSLDEVRTYSCGLLDDDNFTRHFNMEQLKGIIEIITNIQILAESGSQGE